MRTPKKKHLNAGDFSACGRCGPNLIFTKSVDETTCLSCLNAIVVNLNNHKDWRLKHYDLRLAESLDEDADCDGG